MPGSSTRLFVSALLALVSSSAFAALEGAMFVEGGAQGPIAGGSTVTGRENSFPVFEMHHLIRHDGSSIEHPQFIVTVPVGTGIPLLHQALGNQELLAVEVRLYRLSAVGALEHYYSISLDDARVVAAEPMLPDSQDTENQAGHRIRLRFDYRSIEHRDLASGQVAVLEQP